MKTLSLLAASALMLTAVQPVQAAEVESRSNPNVAVPAGLATLGVVGYAIGTVTGTLPAILITAAIAKPADKTLNYAFGGEINHTISGDAGYAAAQGDPGAKFWCKVLDITLGFRAYDSIELSDRSGWEDADHCERRRREDAGELKPTPIDYSAPEWNVGRVGKRFRYVR